MKSIWLISFVVCGACSVKLLDEKDASVGDEKDASVGDASVKSDLKAVSYHRVDDSQGQQAAATGSCTCNTSPCPNPLPSELAGTRTT